MVIIRLPNCMVSTAIVSTKEGLALELGNSRGYSLCLVHNLDVQLGPNTVDAPECVLTRSVNG